MRGAVSELSRALARLFEMIRADRARQRDRIAELEEELARAQSRIRELDASDPLAAPDPDPTDFDALRDAAERLRVRTARIVQEAAEHRATEEAVGLIETQPGSGPGRASDPDHASSADRAGGANGAGNSNGAEDQGGETTAADDDHFPQPAILRVFPGALLAPSLDGEGGDLDVESELGFDPRVMAAVASSPDGAARLDASRDEDATRDEDAARASARGRIEDDLPIADTAEAGPAQQGVISDGPTQPRGASDTPKASTTAPVEPAAVPPRAARARRVSLRRRKIDARKLAAVEPTAALRAMVSAIDGLWTAGNGVDLVIALTDGGALHVKGGDRLPLEVVDVPPGSPARCTVTATTAQLLPLFGRLELSGDQSAPLIHGSRRDADLLVGWIDRAQRLQAQPL